MKLGLIGLLTTISLSCTAGCSTTDVVQRAKDVTSVEVQAPKDAHLVWCKGEAGNCFDAASAFCSTDEGPYSSVKTHTKAVGKFHQIPEAGMSFPAMVQEGDGWRMLIACEPNCAQ